MHEEWTARRTSGTDSISCKYKYKINIVFVACVSRDNHADFNDIHMYCFLFLIRSVILEKSSVSALYLIIVTKVKF